MPTPSYSIGKKMLIGEVARLVAHEVNNHLQGIIGLADLIAEEATNPAWQTSLLEIRQQAEHIAGLQRNFALLLKGAPPAELGPVDLAGVWQGVAGILAGALVRRQIDLHLHLPTDLPAVLGDSDALSQLMTLAVLWHFRSIERRTEWTGTRPVVTIVVAAVEAGAGNSEPGVTWISRDNGIGVPALGAAGKDPVKAENEDDLVTYGRAHCNLIVQRHHASFAIHSPEGAGLELWITLPRG